MISPFIVRALRLGEPGVEAAIDVGVSPLNPASVSSAMLRGPRYSLFEYGAFTRGEQLRDIKDHYHRFFLCLSAHERSGCIASPTP